MRLFIAVTLDEEARDATARCIEKVMAKMSGGSFTRRENLHVTLVFIGETDRVQQVRAILNKVKGEPFELSPTGMGRFKREGGDLYFIRTTGEREMANIADQIAPELRRCGIPADDREFKAHITIGRQVIAPPDLDTHELGLLTPEFHQTVRKIRLMKSERVNGVLTYTEVCSKEL